MIKERQNPSPMKELDIKSELIQEKKHLGRSLSLELKDVECGQKKKKNNQTKFTQTISNQGSLLIVIKARHMQRGK